MLLDESLGPRWKPRIETLVADPEERLRILRDPFRSHRRR